MPGDEPGLVVAAREVLEGDPEFLDGVEGSHPQQVFLQRADEAFGDAVPLRFPDKGGRAHDAQEGQFLPKILRHVIGTAIVTHRQPIGGLGADGSEMAKHALADRFQCLEAIAAPGGMDPDRLGVGVIDRDEDARDALSGGDGLGHAGSPDGVHRVGDDGAIMGLSYSKVRKATGALVAA